MMNAQHKLPFWADHENAAEPQHLGSTGRLDTRCSRSRAKTYKPRRSFYISITWLCQRSVTLLAEHVYARPTHSVYGAPYPTGMYAAAENQNGCKFR